MKHAGSTSLDRLEPLLSQLRPLDGLRERTRGVFYLKSRACLHFHEDPTGLYADFRPPGVEDFERIKVDDPHGVSALLAKVTAALTHG